MPGIGKKNALRMALHLASKGEEKTGEFAEAVKNLGEQLKQCKICFNYSDEEICDICSDASRSKKVICVVENARDVMAVEDTQQFSGVYHVLEGVISPIDGIGPEDIHLDELIQRVRENDVEEVIMAISSTIEGETTTYYLSRRLKEEDVTISVIARGVSFGGDLEYADELTLGRSIVSRQPYHKEKSEG